MTSLGRGRGSTNPWVLALLIPTAGALAQEGPTEPTPPLELAAGEPVALPSTAPDDSAAESGDACEGYSAPFFRGSGGFVVEPTDGRSAELTVQSGDDSDTRTVYAGRNGQAVELLAPDLCASDGSPAECQVRFGGIRGGGWYWVNGDRNAAVAPLVCSEDLGGDTAPLDPGGVQTVTSSRGTGTLFIHDTQGLMGIVPQLSPTGRAGSPSCERYVAPFFRGRGGFVARPASGQTAEVTVERGSSVTRNALSPRSDGLAVELLSDSLCTDSNGQPVECKVSFTGIGEGGWYWVNGDRNAAVAPLVCDGGVSGAPALEPGGVATSRAAFGTGSLFVHDTQRLMGIVPHLSGAAEDDRMAEVRVSVFAGGTVEVVGGGELDCHGTALCVGSFPAAGSVTLRAAAPAEYDFDRWQGCDNVNELDCTVALHADRLVFLSFKRPLTLRDHVVQFDRNRLNDIRQYDPSSGLMVLAADATVDDIEIGSVLVSSAVEPDLTFESPFLRRVTDMRGSSGSSTYVKTTHANLEDLIESGTLAVGLPAGPEATSAAALLPQILPDSHPAADQAARAVSRTSSSFECPELPEAPEEWDYHLPLDACIDEDLPDFTLPSGVEFTGGHVGFGVVLGLSVNMDGALPSEVRAIAKVKGSVQASVEATKQIQQERFTSPIPIEPFYEQRKCATLFFLCADRTLEGEPFVEVDVDVGTAVRGSLTVEGTAGIQWARNGDWLNLSRPLTRSATPHPGFADSNFFKGRVSVKTGLDFTYSSGVSPTGLALARGSAGLSLEPYLETELFEVSSGSCTWDYKLSVGAKADVVLDLTAILNSVASKSYPIWTGSHDLGFGRDCRDEDLVAPPPSATLRFGMITPTTIEVEWDASPKTPEGYDVAYEVLRVHEPQGQFPMIQLFEVADPRFLDQQVLPEREYCYRVRTVVAGIAKSSSYSSELCGWTEAPDVTPPSAPANVVAEALSSGAISLTWDESVDETKFSHYVVSQVADRTGGAADAVTVVTIVTPGFTLARGLNPGTEYCFVVSAVDEAGNESAYSERACASTLGSAEADWRLRIGCTSESYRYEGSFDIGDWADVIVVLGDGTEYDGETPVSWALSGTYDPSESLLDAAILWHSSDLERRDTFSADLSSDDTGDIATSKSGDAGCDAVVRFHKRGEGDDGNDGDGTQRILARPIDESLDPGASGISYAKKDGTRLKLVVDDEVDEVRDAYKPREIGRRVQFSLDDENTSPSGMDSVYPLLYVVDRRRDRVFVYDIHGPVRSGTGVSRRVEAEFELDPANGWAEGITYGEGLFWVVDLDDDKVYAYDRAGVRQPARDFDLTHGSRKSAFGITYVPGGFLYVVDDQTDSLYAYDSAGNRVEPRDTDLPRRDDFPKHLRGVTLWEHAPGRGLEFWLVDARGFIGGILTWPPGILD